MVAKAWLFFPVLLCLSVQSNAQQLEGDPVFTDPAYHQIASIEVFDSTPIATLGATDVPMGIGSGLCGTKPLSFDPMSFGKAKVIFDIIINIGQMAWDIVKANKPQLDIRVDAGTAIPQGLGCWTDLQKFSNARSQYKTILIRNFVGMKAVEFQYRLVWLPGGSYKNKGQYLGYAAMIPSNVYVIGSWKFDANATIPTVFNQGTTSNPIGALTMNMSYRAESHFSVTEQSQTYQVDGTGNIIEL